MLPTCRYSLSVASFSFLSCRMVSVCSPSEYIVTVCDFHLHCSQREDAEIKTELKYKGLAVACCCLYQYPSPPQMSKSRSEGSKIWEHRCGLLASHILLDLFHSYHPKTNRRRRAVFLSDKGVLSYLMANETGKLGHATRLASKTWAWNELCSCSNKHVANMFFMERIVAAKQEFDHPKCEDTAPQYTPQLHKDRRF